jgi:hypothetical protein
MTAIASPPRRRPNRRLAAWNMSVDSPERSANAPIRMNKGMTDSV